MKTNLYSILSNQEILSKLQAMGYRDASEFANNHGLPRDYTVADLEAAIDRAYKTAMSVQKRSK